MFTLLCTGSKQNSILRRLGGVSRGAGNLEYYLRLATYKIEWLSTNVYGSTSPGCIPTAYLQITRVLRLLATNIPNMYNLE